MSASVEPKIGIVGYGFIGRAMLELMARRYSVVAVNSRQIIDFAPVDAKEQERIDAMNSCDLAIICLPTPMGGPGEFKEADLSAVEWWLERLTTPLILIKSTVPPGSTRKWREKYGKRIVFSPEFIGEGKYYTSLRYLHPTDTITHPFMIIAGSDEDTVAVQQIFLPILGPEKEFILTDKIDEAEMMKYLDNTWGALKVSMWNEFFDYCKVLGLNFHRVRELVLKDPRVERMHTAVFENKRGYGGKCFPKDTNALAALLIKKGYEPKILMAAIRKNSELL